MLFAFVLMPLAMWAFGSPAAALFVFIANVVMHGGYFLLGSYLRHRDD